MGPVVAQPKVEVPVAPPMTISEPAVSAPKVSGPALSADLQEQIRGGKKLKPATPIQKPTTEQSALAAGVSARRSMIAEEEEAGEEETDKSAEIAILAEQIKQAFASDKRLTDDIAHKIAAVYVDYPPVDFKTDKKVQHDVTRRIAEYAPSARASGPIALPNVRVPSSAVAAA